MDNKHSKSSRLATLLRFLDKDPANAALRGDVFDAALESGDFTEAGYHVAHALHENPADADWLHREALLLLAQGHFRQAESALNGLVDLGHATPAVLYNLAYAQFGQGEYAKAAEAANALRDDQGSLGPLAWQLWLRCEHHLAHLEEGLAAFIAASSLRPMPPAAWGIASLMAVDASRLREAEAWSMNALAADPDQMEALVTRGSLCLGKQKVLDAKIAFEQALSINVQDGRSWSGLAFTRLLGMDFIGARDAFEKAVAFMPNHIGTWIGLGWCEFLSKRVQAAKSAFEQALALDRNFGESHGALAVALASTPADADRAKTEIEIALKLDPKCLSARYAQAMLSGATRDPEAFQKMTQRILAQHPDPFAGEGEEGKTLADIVLRFQKK